MASFPKAILPLLLLLAACTRESLPFPGETLECSIRLIPPQAVQTRSKDPDEDRIHDINLLIFNSKGVLEEKSYVRVSASGYQLRKRFIKGCSYSIYACANLGYSIRAGSMEELLSERYHMVYPDEYPYGMPMGGRLEGHVIDGSFINIQLERFMARITLSIDRSALDEGIGIKVASAEIGGCPCSVKLFGSSGPMSENDVFSRGFFKDGMQADPLNISDKESVSGEVSLYMLENMQGDAQGPLRSYIELKMEYNSPRWKSRPGEYLVTLAKGPGIMTYGGIPATALP